MSTTSERHSRLHLKRQTGNSHFTECGLYYPDIPTRRTTDVLSEATCKRCLKNHRAREDRRNRRITR